MITFASSFLVGILLALQLRSLPAMMWLLLLSLFFLTLFIFFKKTRYQYLIKIILAMVLGFSYLVMVAEHRLAWSLPTAWQQKPLQITGIIASIPEVSPQRIQFEFKVSSMRFGETALKGQPLILLSAYKDSLQNVTIGEQWHLTVRLKQPHGSMNPGGFDYERWLFQKGIRATGYVVQSSTNQKIESHLSQHPIDRIRSQLADGIADKIGDSPMAGMITALTLGVQSGITQDQWATLRDTGTSHLMAISGLHITLVAGLMYVLAGWLWRRNSKLLLKIPAPCIAAFAGLCTAFIYSALAGFSVPTQRAMVMLSVFWGCQLFKRHVEPWHGFFLALILVLILDPTAPMTASFWLSFSAVGCLIYGLSARLAPKGWWWKWGRAQWVVTLGLFPLGLFYFQQSSIISPLANIIAIPWVSFIVVPLALLGCITQVISSTLSSILLVCAAETLQWIWYFLEWCANVPSSSWYYTFNNTYFFLIAVLSVFLLLAPRGYPARWVGCLGLLPVLGFVASSKPAMNQFVLTVLDVGQGLSAVVQTQNHTLVFDTGPASPDGFNAGEAIINPFLHHEGIRKIDRLVVSHSDLDHRGGAPSIAEQFHIDRADTGEVINLPSVPQYPCAAGERWIWDGVTFEFFYPPRPLQATSDNDYSCVLKVTTGEHSILLTGDIEKDAEQWLVDNEGHALKAEVLVVPHHGSRTSSTLPFLKAVAPKYAVYPTGYLNRFRFPSKIVAERYAMLGVLTYNTGLEGAVTFEVMPQGLHRTPQLARVQQHRFWNALP